MRICDTYPDFSACLSFYKYKSNKTLSDKKGKTYFLYQLKHVTLVVILLNCYIYTHILELVKSLYDVTNHIIPHNVR